MAANPVLARNHSSTESRRDANEAQRRGPAPDEEELATKMLHIQSKRIYLDVKQNGRGRFIKIAEVGASGRKSRLVMSIVVASQFHKCLVEFGEFCTTLNASKESVPENGLLKSKVLRKKNRRYYVDLRENDRGRFLRVTQTTIDGDGPRSQVALPAQGISEIRDALNDILNEYGAEDVNSISPSRLPEGKQIKSEKKMLYFDIGQNERGVFMRISEVKRDFRSAITVPESSWRKMHEYLGELCDQMEALKVESADGAKTSEAAVVGKTDDDSADVAVAAEPTSAVPDP